MGGAFRVEDDSLANRVSSLREERAELVKRLRARPARVSWGLWVVLAVLGFSAIAGPLGAGCVSCNHASTRAVAEHEQARRDLCRALWGRR